MLTMEEAKKIAEAAVKAKKAGYVFLYKIDESMSEEKRFDFITKVNLMMIDIVNEELNLSPGPVKGQWQYRGYILFEIKGYSTP